MEYQKAHIDTWLQPQAKIFKNVSTIGQSAKRILILNQSFKKIPTLSQHTCAKLILCWDKLSDIKPIYMYYYYFKYVFASNTQKFLVQWLGAITIWSRVIVLRV